MIYFSAIIMKLWSVSFLSHKFLILCLHNLESIGWSHAISIKCWSVKTLIHFVPQSWNLWFILYIIMRLEYVYAYLWNCDLFYKKNIDLWSIKCHSHELLLGWMLLSLDFMGLCLSHETVICFMPQPCNFALLYVISETWIYLKQQPLDFEILYACI